MINTIIHPGLRAFFQKGKPLPASLSERIDGLCYWLSILNAATCQEDLILAGSRCTRGRQGYRLTVDGLGEFTFLITNNCIEKLNFKKA